MGEHHSERHHAPDTLKCTYCKKTITKSYWQRALSNEVLCRECWLDPPFDITDQVRRDQVAEILRKIRRENRKYATEVHMSLRGMGVPQRVRRKRRPRKQR